jgi:hypothetical protein
MPSFQSLIGERNMPTLCFSLMLVLTDLGDSLFLTISMSKVGVFNCHRER